ncbi:glycosyl hydrolase family 95 catalytic domain-containing protein [Streptomyces sp. WI04-05B]|uniref:glycosyl hydrolase family 95 catalytic domain-containing protein n=1 Tax=Streptomyces TaxID=1883 RepID=UPI0029BBD52E|nr:MULTISPECIES: glycoside hydrolase N-terminal domain-containing protein [unclassified Streptomyces]MDX2542008.1 glycoside hydrolase N-terminal domain-containing protein [Streptomyces sp. WI04-05B]MDX2587090.1 glycoside hydrolase N-terminal domain-containing protein [Streptomyces sp. WI04-05A]
MTEGPVHGTWEPHPATRWEDGYLSGNGRHGALVFGDPESDRVVVTHHTLVRPNGSEYARPPRLADRLADLQDRLLTGDTTAAESFTDGRELRWVQPFHPAFQVRLRGGGPPAGPGHDYRRSVDFTTGVTDARSEDWHSRVFVSRADDVIVQYVTCGTGVAGGPDGAGVSAAAGVTGGAWGSRVLGDTGAPGGTGVSAAAGVTGGAWGSRVLGDTGAPGGTGGPGGTGVSAAAGVTGGAWGSRVPGDTGSPGGTRGPGRTGVTRSAGTTGVTRSPGPTGGTRGPGPTGGAALALDIDLDHRLPGAPTELGVGQSVVRTSEGALLTLRARYPGSDRAYTGVTLVVPTGGETTLTPPGVRVEGAESVLLLTRVVRHVGELDTADQARALRDLLPDQDGESGSQERTYERLLARHISLHRTAYDRVTLDLAADEAERALPGAELLTRTKSPALLERLFAAGRYHLLSAAGMFPPRLVGLWTGDWNTAWSGAFTTNANLNLQTASAAAGALPEVTEAHASLIHRQLDDWRENARTIFGARGVVAPSHTDGESGLTYHFSREYPLHLWTAGADWLLKPLVDHDDTTGVRDPRTSALLAEVAEFYEDFLTRTDADGHLVVVPSYSPENRPANASWGALNAAMDLSAARHALLTAADHHPDDPERAARWRALADRLPPHRVNADGALAEWAWPSLDDTYDHRHLSHLYGVWPLDEINPYDTPDLAAAAHRALQLRGAENDSAHGHLHHALIAARLRDGERVTRALGQVLDGDFFHASLMSAHYPGRDVYNADAAHALPAVLIEALVQSTPDRLVLLPALPATCPTGRIRGVRTRFGAEVDLDWEPGRGRAVVRPTRSRRIDLRTSSGAHTLDLVAGEDRVLDLGPR